MLAVAEAGMGFAFLGVVIGYLPTIYSAFSRRASIQSKTVLPATTSIAAANTKAALRNKVFVTQRPVASAGSPDVS